ncbi:hypothetical protein HCA69_15595 [Listeria grandensis]|uniref:Uncharacterized protein n=1 Tax=Listeria grandensis TaxID=1494963 RepID=A0A7X1CR72_9LIST|nr:hypothetical protein [Listeria grandensis]MBC1937793.1 hypothetical protein [Listeria grandensis]
MLYCYLQSEDARVPGERMSFAEANTLLQGLSTENYRQKKVTRVDILRLVEADEKVDYFQGYYEAGSNPDTLYEHIMHTVMQIQTPRKEQKLLLLEKLAASIMVHDPEPSEPTPASGEPQEKAVEKKVEQIAVPRVTAEKNETSVEHHTPKESMLPALIKRPKKQHRTWEMPSLLVHWKKGLIALSLLLVLGIGTCSLLVYFASADEEKPPEKPSYQDLLAKDAYLEAAATYPDKQTAIETIIVQEHVQGIVDEAKQREGIKQLQSFVAKYPSAQGDFDVAFYMKNWANTKRVFEANPKAFQEDIGNVAKMAYAYLKLGDMEQAKNLSLGLNSPILEGKIKTYEQLQKKRVEVEKKLKEPKLLPANKQVLQQALDALNKQIDAL